MVGALLGDFIGSAYEFNPIKAKEFDLYTNRSHFTDDSVLTIAVADATLNYLQLILPANGYVHSEEAYKRILLRYIHSWALVYPFAGYGGRFRKWIESDNYEPYNSYGNGSAMRVSSIGWLFDNINDVLTFAKWSAEITHNHPEGIKGAQAVATAIFLARSGSSKEVIKNTIENNFGYNLNRTVDQIRPKYKFEVSCQKSVPEAIICFLDSDSYLDAVKNAISLGGDADTQACIAGSIAEAFYGTKVRLDGIPVDSSMNYVIQNFDNYLKHSGMNKKGLKI